MEPPKKIGPDRWDLLPKKRGDPGHNFIPFSVDPIGDMISKNIYRFSQKGARRKAAKLYVGLVCGLVLREA
ncbi:MAG: hypothetical protein DMF62_02395 [Acidobacteria bacterium]|nr:MAG: hypothetical protein DMF62_02395 [Acidobacteriota bacterium]